MIWPSPRQVPQREHEAAQVDVSITAVRLREVVEEEMHNDECTESMTDGLDLQEKLTADNPLLLTTSSALTPIYISPTESVPAMIYSDNQTTVLLT